MRACAGEFIHLLESFRAHQRKVNRDPKGHQTLVGADVGSSLFAADVLLAGLKCKHEATLAGSINALAYDTAGEFAHVVALASQESHIRTAIAKRNAEGLSVTHGYICPPFCGSLEDCQGGRITVFN